MIVDDGDINIDIDNIDNETKNETIIKNPTINIKRLIFEGGGVKGIAIVGVLKKLEELNILNNVTEFAGSSAGAFMALLLTLNYNSDTIRRILLKTNFNLFLKNSFGFFRDGIRFLRYFGINKTSYMERVIKQLILLKTDDKPEITFKQLFDLTGKELLITGTNLSTPGVTEYFHRTTTPDMPVYLATLISMSFPIVFVPIIYNNNYYVDGGMLENYPFDSFYKLWLENNERNKNTHVMIDTAIDTTVDSVSKSKSITTLIHEEKEHIIPIYSYNDYLNETLGIRMDTPSEISEFKNKKILNKNINNIQDFVLILIDSLLISNDKLQLKDEIIERTIFIETDISSTDFKLTIDMKKKLYDLGYESCGLFMDKLNKNK